jgi:hypothetical protein
MKEAPGRLSPLRMILIDRSFPWWYSSFKAVDVNVTNIWLYGSLSTSQFHIVRALCVDAVVENGVEPSTAFLKAASQSDAIFINGAVPRALEVNGLWNSPQGTRLRLVVHTESTRNRPRSPWKSLSTTLTHSEVGGVTSGVYTLFCHVTPRIVVRECVIIPHEQVQRSLRWILKSKEVGQLVKAPLEMPSCDEVKWYKAGIIHEAGLLPIGVMEVRVLTRFRHNQWVIRPLTQFERLLALDVPEHLIRELVGEHDREWLLASVHTPIKVLQCVADHFANLLRQPEECGGEQAMKRIASVASTVDLDVTVARTAKRRGSTQTHHSKEKGQLMMDQVGENRMMEDCAVDSELRIDDNAVATKSDDAEVRTALWMDKLHQGFTWTIGGEGVDKAVTILQGFFLRIWKRLVIRSFQEWLLARRLHRLVVSEDMLKDGWDCCRRANLAMWWSWEGGSRPFFWRWPPYYQSPIREGVTTWFSAQVKRWTLRQRRPKTPEILNLMREKIDVIRLKAYVEAGKIDSLMSFFDVPKGKDDIRMVYDGTKSGLNESLWAPWFPLPTADTLVRALEPGYFMADNDVGETRYGCGNVGIA